MVSTFTPNINIEEPARGDDVGTWDTPVNNNMTLLDLTIGANTAVGLGSGNVTLSIAQYRSRVITFNSTLIQNTVITFPSTFTKDYTVVHACTGSSAFTITLMTTVSGGAVVAIPPGQGVEVYNDGTNLKFLGGGLPMVGEYVDYPGTTVPAWVSACTVPPFLNCNAGTFSAATYPALAAILGSTTVPDLRGVSRATLNQGTGRITSGISGLDGNTIFSVGGNQSLQSHTHANSLTDPGHTHTAKDFGGVGSGPFVPPSANAQVSVPATYTILSAVTGISITNASAGAGGSQNMPPTTIAGITMVRAG
jgi:hypothetical protein